MKCLRCGHEWETKSDYRFVSCPNCLSKVKNPGAVGRPFGSLEDLDHGGKTS